MRLPLIILTIPLTISFLGGMFEWYFEDGFYLLLGLAIIIGLVWAWIVELKK